MKQNKLWDKFESHLLNEGVTRTRTGKLLTMFRMAERGLQKPYEKLTREHIENFLNDMHRNKFKRLDGKNLSGSTKSDVKRFLKQFYKWFEGDNEFYPKKVSWIKTRINKDELPQEKPVLNQKEVVKLADSYDRVELRMLVLLLFDSGFRISEMLSVKKRDITWEDYADNDKCFWVLCNQSKTEKRKVPIPLFTKEVKEFMNSVYVDRLKDDDLIFTINYYAFLKSLRLKSIEVLKRKISPHCLRHSSATYYSILFGGDMNLICQKFGWTFNSLSPRIYIRRSGTYQKLGAKKVFSNEVVKVQEENEKLKVALEESTEDIKKLFKMYDEMKDMRDKFERVLEVKTNENKN